jgi:transcriptional regulator with GAF, ATPase, and Fis domain
MIPASLGYFPRSLGNFSRYHRFDGPLPKPIPRREPATPPRRGRHGCCLCADIPALPDFRRRFQAMPSPFDALIVGKSARMRAVVDFVRIISTSDSTVLITGESGTGKEVTASLIHQTSRRKQRPFVPVSCALFSETLIESELFGHERGAFTGALRDRPGRFELAEGGTIFLDDIDDVPLTMQVKLLRVIQNRTVERLGGCRPLPVNVRILAGSKRDLRTMVADGTFREDLYYRLNVLPLTLPPLRDRREDIPVLTAAFLEKFFQAKGETVPSLSEALIEAFNAYDWPGNVRELENACERIAQMWTRDGDMASMALHLQPESSTARVSPPAPRPIGSEGERPISLEGRLRDLEKSLIIWALNASHGNKSRAARLLQIKRSTLGDRIRHCGLDASIRHGSSINGREAA